MITLMWYNVYIGGENMSNQEKIESILMDTKRDGVESVVGWLRTTDFYTAPASTKFHGNFKGGLAEHSLSVYKRLQQVCKDFNIIPPDESSIAVCALLHDVCKIGFYTQSTRNVKNEITGQWEKKPFYLVNEQFAFGGHGSKSVYLVQHFLPLHPEEAVAINCHMGAWDESDYSNVGQAYSQNPFAWALHVADEASTYLDERTEL